MKRNLKYLITMILPLVIFATSCRKDLGNYDYKEITEIGITGIDSSYAVATGEILHIEPKITLTQNISDTTGRFSYEWSWVDGKILSVIATTQNFNKPVPLPPGGYNINYRVTDKVTGILYRKQLYVQVTTAIGSGWLILNDVNGESRLDMRALNGTTQQWDPYTDVLATVGSDLKLKGTPELVYTMRARMLDATSEVYGVYVGTNQSTDRIDGNTFQWNTTFNLRYEKLTPSPENFHANWFRSNGSSANVYMKSGDDIYYSSYTYRQYYSTPINRLSLENGGAFIPSKFVSVPLSRSTSSMCILMYDVVNKRFYRHVGARNGISTVMPSGSFYDPNDMKQDLVFMDYTTALGGQTMAIMKDPTTLKYYLARAIFTPTTYVQQAYHEMIATDLDKAEQFALDPQRGYIMYNVGSKVYQYDVSEQTSKLMLDLGSRKISLIKYQKMIYGQPYELRAELNDKLIVCTYEPGSPESTGKMQLYTVPALGDPLSIYQEFDGFAKIVDVSYKEIG